MEMRDLAPEHLSALVDLCQRTLPFDQWSLPLLQEQLFEQPFANPSQQILAWDNGKLVAAMLGGTRMTDQGAAAWVRLFATDPAYQRKGLASQLLQELEDRFRRDGFTKLFIANTVPGYFWPGLDVRYTSAFCFLQRNGFERTGDGINMQVDLLAHSWDTADEEAFLSLEGFTIRRLEQRDMIAFSDWLHRTWGPAWQAEGLISLKREPVSTFIAEYNGRICAFASYGVAAFPYGFGPTGTEETLRGKGLGRVLFYRCMNDLKTQGHTFAEVCWVGPIAFYAKVANAWISRVFWYMSKDL